jgi:hypothetical protein
MNEQPEETFDRDGAASGPSAGGLIPRLLDGGPVLFGVGFLAPLIAQTLDALSIEVPFAPSNLAFGLCAGGLAGLIAWKRGSWL